jgi:hypothetical protein
MKMKMNKNAPPIDPFIGCAVFGSAGSIEEQLNSDDSELEPEFDEQLPEPFKSFFERVQLDALGKTAGVQDFSWDAPVSAGDAAVTLEKRATADNIGGTLVKTEYPKFQKSSIGFKLKMARVETRIIDGNYWLVGFDAAGGVVDMQIVDPPSNAV